VNPTTTSNSRLAAAVTAPVARITLEHAPLNVIDIAMLDELIGTLAEIESHTAVTVIVISGSGKAFSAGVDVAAHAPNVVDEMLGRFHLIIRNLVSSKKVTIAQVHGHCLGGGAELAMVCDLAYTTESAQWGFPEIKLACYPPVACTALSALVGQKRAAELILTGRTITGCEAAEIGLATRAVPDGELSSIVEDSVQRLLKCSSAALALAKKSSYAWDSMHFDKGLARAEKIYFEELLKTFDVHEGVAAFLEKREPKWKGK